MDRTIRLWDVHTGKHKQQLDGHSKGVRSLAYSPEYRFLVSAGFDFDALVWNPYVDQLILRLHGHNNSLCGVEIIPDTPQIITADVDGVFKVWDIRNFACMQTFSAENMGEVKTIVTMTSQKRIVAAGKKVSELPAFASTCTCPRSLIGHSVSSLADEIRLRKAGKPRAHRRSPSVQCDLQPDVAVVYHSSRQRCQDLGRTTGQTAARVSVGFSNIVAVAVLSRTEIYG